MKKLQTSFGFVMGIALLSGCTNTLGEQPFFPPAPPPAPLEVDPAPAPAPTPVVDPAPAPAPNPAPVTPEPPAPEPAERFGLFKGIIQEALPASSGGSGSAVRFMNYTTNKRYTTMASSDAGVVPVTDVPNAGLTFMMNEEGERLAIILGSVKPGHYDCAASGFAVGFAFPDEAIDGEEASWSDRPGASCEFDLWAGENTGDIQGSFKGTLTTLEGHSLSIADGYFYARNPQVTPPPAVWTPGRTAAPHAYHR